MQNSIPTHVLFTLEDFTTFQDLADIKSKESKECAEMCLAIYQLCRKAQLLTIGNSESISDSKKE